MPTTCIRLLHLAVKILTNSQVDALDAPRHLLEPIDVGAVLGHAVLKTARELSQARVAGCHVAHVDESSLARGEVPNGVFGEFPVLGSLLHRRVSSSAQRREEAPQLEILLFQEVEGGTAARSVVDHRHGQIPPSTRADIGSASDAGSTVPGNLCRSETHPTMSAPKTAIAMTAPSPRNPNRAGLSVIVLVDMALPPRVTKPIPMDA
jgi:hypothetical protein